MPILKLFIMTNKMRIVLIGWSWFISPSESSNEVRAFDALAKLALVTCLLLKPLRKRQEIRMRKGFFSSKLDFCCQKKGE